jgi:hypothetical protein
LQLNSNQKLEKSFDENLVFSKNLVKKFKILFSNFPTFSVEWKMDGKNRKHIKHGRWCGKRFINSTIKRFSEPIKKYWSKMLFKKNQKKLVFKLAKCSNKNHKKLRKFYSIKNAKFYNKNYKQMTIQNI